MVQWNNAIPTFWILPTFQLLYNNAILIPKINKFALRYATYFCVIFFLFLQLTSHQTVWNYLKNRLLVRLLGTLVATIHRIWNGNSLLLVRHHQFLKLQDITVLCRAPAPNVSVSNHLKTPFLSALATLTSSLWMTLMRISLPNSQIISLLPK